ncbi:hypothetical protein [Aestuariimicrobium sp. Y1814]|uniref:hypothetical protein n=1 Tax=Aestuariimicrobium sp. Y1814 TaxID=3418742 RepID=UPI003DA74E15
MIRVATPKAPASLSSERTLAERKAALDFYATWDGTGKYDKYTAYKNPDVRAALELAFGRKCAYCESSYGATQPVAIEHYRPKGGVTIDGTLTPPGYYWLASEWTNLLPSCTDCNSPRRQELPTGTRTAGKANAFPLAKGETGRAAQPGQERDEQRLVLHPYLDHPEKHLTFTWDTGTIDDGWVVPTPSSRGRPSPKGQATIEVCALQRRGLVENRRAHLQYLLGALEGVREAVENIAAHPDDPRLVTQYERNLAEVKKYLGDHDKYAAMCRQVVTAYYRRLFGD